jgi:hypothetical protein
VVANPPIKMDHFDQHEFAPDICMAAYWIWESWSERDNSKAQRVNKTIPN